jgi:hypothetical protein
MRLPIQAVREAAQNMAPSSSKKTKSSTQPDVSDVARVAAVASHLVSRFIPAQIIRERPRDGAHSAASLAGELRSFLSVLLVMWSMMIPTILCIRFIGEAPLHSHETYLTHKQVVQDVLRLPLLQSSCQATANSPPPSQQQQHFHINPAKLVLNLLLVSAL